MNKEVKKIFIVLALFSFSGGIFYNFQELWMAENNLSLKTISTVYSICALLTISIIFLCSNLVSKKRTKKFANFLLLLKTLLMLSFFFLHHSGYNILIKFLIMLDYVVDVETYACIYPIISNIEKDDKLYAKRGLIYSFFYNISALLAGLMLGKNIININIDYNFYALIAALVSLIATIKLFFINIDKYQSKKENNESNDTFYRLLKNIKNDKPSHSYLAFVFFGGISFYAITTLVLTIFINNYSLNPTYASFLTLALGIGSSILGAIVLSIFTFKNDYINITIKYITRIITYLIAAITGNSLVLLIAIIFTKISSDSYANISDAPYINRFQNEFQFAFCNLREMVGYAGRAIGAFLCGLVISSNIRYIFIIASIFSIIQVIFAYRGIYLREKDLK